METGVLFALAASLFWGTNPVLIKRGLTSADVSEATLYQQAAVLATLIVDAYLEGELEADRLRWVHIAVFCATGFVGAYLGRTLFVRSVNAIGAARSQALVNASPLVTVFLAVFLLGESLTLTLVLGAALISGGILFVGPGEEEKGNPTVCGGLSFTALLAVLCYGIVPVLKRFGTEQGAPPVLSSLIMHASGLVLLLAFGSVLKVEFPRRWIPLPSLIYFIAAGILYGLGSVFTLKALVHAPASIVAPVWSTQPLVTWVLAKATLRGIEEVGWKEAAAVGLVVLGVGVLRLG